MRRLAYLALGLVAALGGATLALAQGHQPYQPQYPMQYNCITQNGTAVQCQLSDIPAPDVTKPNTAPTPEKKAQVVAASPNSGGFLPYPSGATPLIETATGTTAGTTATFPATPGRTNYICGFTVSPGSAATAITITITTTGLTANMSLSVGAPVTAVGTTGTIITVPISPCVPASASNTAITVVAGALGTSGVGQAVNAWGFRL
jgi:hypothetical protein